MDIDRERRMKTKNGRVDRHKRGEGGGTNDERDEDRPSCNLAFVGERIGRKKNVNIALRYTRAIAR